MQRFPGPTNIPLVPTPSREGVGNNGTEGAHYFTVVYKLVDAIVGLGLTHGVSSDLQDMQSVAQLSGT